MTNVHSKEISVEYGGATFTMKTDRIDSDTSKSPQQKEEAVEYLEDNWKIGRLSPMMWEKRISSPLGFDYKTEIFWYIKLKTDELSVNEELPENFILQYNDFEDVPLDIDILMYENGDQAEIRLYFSHGDQKFILARSSCVIPRSFSPASLGLTLKTGRMYTWGEINSNGYSIENLPIKILPEMKEEIKKKLRQDTKISLVYAAKRSVMMSK